MLLQKYTFSAKHNNCSLSAVTVNMLPFVQLVNFYWAAIVETGNMDIAVNKEEVAL